MSLFEIEQQKIIKSIYRLAEKTYWYLEARASHIAAQASHSVSHWVGHSVTLFKFSISWQYKTLQILQHFTNFTKFSKFY